MRRLAWAGGALAAAVAALAVATLLGLQPLPERLPPGAEELRKAQLVDRVGRPLTVTYENDWNVHDRVALAHMPPLLIEAFIQAEDRRFYTHGGIDWRARVAAVWQNLRALRAVRGASTISEQAVRMLNPRPRTLWSRWLEGWEARRLEARFGKAAVLEFYLNQVPYASRRRGVVQAARHYFQRDLTTLSPREVLALAVLVRAPSRFDPYRSAQTLEPALLRLAERMAAIGALDEAAHRGIATTSLELAPFQESAPVRQFAEQLITRLPEHLRRRAELATTLDSVLQTRVHAVLDEWRRALAPQGVRNAAALVVDHRSGEILAWVNAHEPGVGSAYDAVTVPRQPGSSLKPFVYAAALERGWTAATLIDDSPLSEAVGRGQHAYRNYSRSYYGPVRLRDALGNSLNIPAVRAAQYVGPAELLGLLRAFGIHSLNRHPDYYGDGIALGNGEVTLLELTSAYAALANDGRYRPLTALLDLPSEPARDVVARPTAHLIANILADPDARRLEFGTGGLMRFPIETAVKTGTSSDYRDAWGFAFNHRYTAGVWMGSLDGSPMQEITGARGPVPVLRAIFAELNRRTPPQSLPLDGRLVRLDICRDTGLPAEGDCPRRSEWFLPDHLPQAAQTADEPARARIRQPSWDLELALDPRLPDERERFAFQVDGVGENERVRWRVNGKAVGISTGPELLWTLQRGRHTVSAEILHDDGRTTALTAVPFRVR